jgi:hypothetical protein
MMSHRTAMRAPGMECDAMPDQASLQTTRIHPLTEESTH